MREHFVRSTCSAGRRGGQQHANKCLQVRTRRGWGNRRIRGEAGAVIYVPGRLIPFNKLTVRTAARGDDECARDDNGKPRSGAGGREGMAAAAVGVVVVEGGVGFLPRYSYMYLRRYRRTFVTGFAETQTGLLRALSGPVKKYISRPRDTRQR